MFALSEFRVKELSAIGTGEVESGKRPIYALLAVGDQGAVNLTGLGIVVEDVASGTVLTGKSLVGEAASLTAAGTPGCDRSLTWGLGATIGCLIIEESRQAELTDGLFDSVEVETESALKTVGDGISARLAGPSCGIPVK